MSTETLETRVANRISAMAANRDGSPGDTCPLSVGEVAGIVRDELDAELEKSKHGHRGLVGELETTRTKLRLAEGRVAELEGALAKAMEGAAPGFTAAFEVLAFSGWQKIVAITVNQRKSIAFELDRRANVMSKQAAELERLRNIVSGLREVCGGEFVKHLELRKLDGSPAQAEPQFKPCTGAEFVEAAQRAIEPRSDEELRAVLGGHHEGCDVFQSAPDGGPSQKPCNCRGRDTGSDDGEDCGEAAPR